jgi:2-desacetyl-2-hydroxyethyl bacteriochlorophyllide A dehydrogenase
MSLSSKARQNPVVRSLAFGVVKHVMGGEKKAVPFWLRWGMARAQAAPRMRRLVRGTAVVWPEPGRAFTIGRDFPTPGRGQVLIRASASAISPGTEKAFFLRSPNTSPTFPHFPGYSMAGEVVAFSKELPFQTGDLVAAAAPHASLAVVNASQVYPVPNGITPETASFVQLGVIAVNAVEQSCIHRGASVIVFGHGIIGQLLVQLAAALGASPVISVARTDRRVCTALTNSAQKILILERDGIDALRELEASIILDATGQPDAIPLALLAVGPSGTIVIVGSPREATRQTDFGELADKKVTILGAHAGRLLQPADHESRARAAEHVTTFFRLVAEGQLDLDPMISARIHPWEADWFYRRLARADDATVGAVFCWDLLEEGERIQRVSYLTAPDLAPLSRGQKVGRT